jgi:hypothetical protein
MMGSAPHIDFDPDFAGPAEWASMYRALGLQVIPCYMPDEAPKGTPWKRPKLAEWTEYRKNLAPQATFERWYGKGGEHVGRSNMGMVTGMASGNVLVIDLDDHKTPTAAAWWHDLIESENSGIEPQTVEQHTGGGGRQKLFRFPEGFRAPTNRTSIGVDIRGTGGFALLPPSRHESGHVYEWAKGHAPWETDIAIAPQWLLDAVEMLVEAHGGDRSGGDSSVPRETTASPSTDFDDFGHRTDGREAYMARVVWASILDHKRENPIGRPSDTEQQLRASVAYSTYERSVVSRLNGAEKTELLEREGRGPTAFLGKWRASMRHWDDRVAEEAAKQPRSEGGQPHDWANDFETAAEKAEEQAKVDPAKQFELLDLKQIESQPDPVWLVDKLIIERSLGFIFGPKGSLKTFIGLDIALSITSKLNRWWGYDINKPGAVVYVCAEGHASLKFRTAAWRHNRRYSGDAPFFLLKQNVNFLNPEDVGKLKATLETAVARASVPIAAIFVDTVSKVLPGSDENLQKDMSVFVAVCGQIQERFGCVVIGIHHTNKQGGMRGSTVLPNAGDFIIEAKHEPGAERGSIYVHNVKDGEDGIERVFHVKRVDLPMGRSSLVVDGTDDKPSMMLDERGWPGKNIEEEILTAIAQQWFKKQPWGASANSARPAVAAIMRKWKLKRDVVKDMLATWEENGLIVEDILDLKNKVKGYRKSV